MAPSTFNQLKEVFERLAFLEKWKESSADQILQLKKDNLEMTRANEVLDKEVKELKREITRTKQQLTETGLAVDKLNQVIKGLSGHRLNGDLASRLDKVEAETKMIVKCKKDIVSLKSLQKILNRCVVRHGAGGLEKQVQRVDKLDCQTCHRLSNQVEGLSTQMKTLKDKHDFKNSTVFRAFIKPTQPLVTGSRVKLNHCDGVFTPGSYFVKEGCEYTIPESGLYDVGLSMLQEGNGRLKVRVKVKGQGAVMIGKTGGHEDVSNCRGVIGLHKGRKMSVDVVRLDGTAGVGHCVLSGFLVCPF